VQDSTDDEDGLEAPPQRSAIQDNFQPKPQHQPKKLGTIGGSKAASNPATQDKSPEFPAKYARSQDMVDDNTASEDEDAPKFKTVKPEERLTSPPASRAKKGGLGKIGGKKRETTPPAPVVASPEEHSLPDRTPKPKLGHIGHRPPAKDVAKDDDVARYRTREKTVEEQPRETSKERADRKREELKRQLEEKAKAPAKKKRKF